MAATRSICPLDLEHILQYSITGWSPGCSGEESQLLHLLKDGFMNNVAVTKIRKSESWLDFFQVHFTPGGKMYPWDEGLCLSPVWYFIQNKTSQKQENDCVFSSFFFWPGLIRQNKNSQTKKIRKKKFVLCYCVICVFMLFCFVLCSSAEHWNCSVHGNTHSRICVAVNTSLNVNYCTYRQHATKKK